MIIEVIVTTRAPDGSINVAPMGVDWPDDSRVSVATPATTLTLKPFLETTTFRNLQTTGVAVVNLTDDVRVFARAAIGNPAEPTVPATTVAGVVLADTCTWYEVQVASVDATPPRSRIETRVVHHGTRREFLGFNRARHAVLEAAILATRLHLVPHDEIRAEVRRLQVLVDKTAGVREREAWTLLTDYIAART
ncbi:MAG TPA: DUF447 domain-containing protein [Gemmatimonadaceae bacterium]|nr:DUF447 domain-containing protein [Gemmatimonadaceae bacterium]